MNIQDSKQLAKANSSPQLTTEDKIQQELNRIANRKAKVALILPYLGLVLLVVLFTVFTNGQFIAAANLKLLLDQCYVMVVVIIGATFLYAIGGLDMSIGSVMALSAVAMTMMLNAGIPLLVCFLTGVAISVVSMSITALARNYLGIPSFIASMCVMSVCQGIVLTVVGKMGTIAFPHSRFAWLSTTTAKIAILAVMLVAGYFLFNLTSFGKSLKAIGGNARVAEISGVKVRRVTWLAYALVGLTITIAAVFSLFRAGKVDAGIGAGLNLNVMTAIVLGGFPLTGGSNAKFSAPIVGALTVTCLTNGLGLLGQSNYLGYAIKGLLFLVVVSLTYEKSKGKLIS